MAQTGQMQLCNLSTSPRRRRRRAQTRRTNSAARSDRALGPTPRTPPSAALVMRDAASRSPGPGSFGWLLVMPFRGHPRGLFGLFHSLTAALWTGTARRSAREKGVAGIEERRSFYPVLVPKPGLRYQLGPAKPPSGQRPDKMMQACDRTPAGAWAPLPALDGQLQGAVLALSSFDSSISPLSIPLTSTLSSPFQPPDRCRTSR